MCTMRLTATNHLLGELRRSLIYRLKYVAHPRPTSRGLLDKYETNPMTRQSDTRYMKIFSFEYASFKKVRAALMIGFTIKCPTTCRLTLKILIFRAESPNCRMERHGRSIPRTHPPRFTWRMGTSLIQTGSEYRTAKLGGSTCSASHHMKKILYSCYH